jgi:hypothetical protein
MCSDISMHGFTSSEAMARAYAKEKMVERESQDHTWRRNKLRCALIPMQIISDSDTDLHMCYVLRVKWGPTIHG